MTLTWQLHDSCAAAQCSPLLSLWVLEFNNQNPVTGAHPRPDDPYHVTIHPSPASLASRHSSPAHPWTLLFATSGCCCREVKATRCRLIRIWASINLVLIKWTSNLQCVIFNFSWTLFLFLRCIFTEKNCILDFFCTKGKHLLFSSITVAF